MNLDSLEEFTLLRNCTILEIINLHQKQASQQDLADFFELFDLLKSENLETARAKLISGTSDKFSEFRDSFQNNSSAELSTKYLNLAKSLLSKEQFDKIKNQFEKQSQKAEQESTYLTPEMQSALDILNKLIKHNHPKTISPDQFRTFSSQFRDVTGVLGKLKFEQCFLEQNKTIRTMKISYDSSQYDQTVYRTDFTLLDSNSQESQLTITEPAPKSKFISNYFQNLCYTYLESHRCSTLKNSLLDKEVMAKELNIFPECLKKLEEMSKCKINLFGNKVYFSDETAYESDKLNEFFLEAKQSSPYYDGEELTH